MEGIGTVIGVIANTVNSVTLKEARLLTGNKVSVCVGEVLGYVMSVVSVKGDKLLLVDLGVGRLSDNYSVIVSRKCAGSVAGLQLSAKGNSKFKYAVGKIDDRLLQSRIKLNLQEVGFAVDLEFVTLFIFAVKMLVNLIAKCLEFNIAVLTDKL